MDFSKGELIKRYQKPYFASSIIKRWRCINIEPIPTKFISESDLKYYPFTIIKVY